MSLSGGLNQGHFTIQVEGEVQLDRALSRWSNAVSDVSEYYRLVVKFLEKAVEGQLASQGTRSGDSWAPLSPRYAQYKARKFGPKPILEAAGHMKKDFHTRTLTASELAWGSTLRYPRYHQTGTKRMPQRKIIALTDEDRRSLMKELQRFIMRKGSGGAVQV